MYVTRFASFAELAPHVSRWNQLAGGVPFRQWSWLESWWRHYGTPPIELYLVAAIDDACAPVAILPCSLRRSATQGRVLTLLGGGEVCSDYLGLMCQPGLEETAAALMAEWLVDVASGKATAQGQSWHALRLDGIDCEDMATLRLIEQLEQRGATVSRRDGANCWRLPLHESWDDYLAGLSKTHRKQVRRLERGYLDSGRAVLHQVRNADDFERGWAILVDLHQRRRQSLGEPGCFASAQFAAFHCDVAQRLLSTNQLRLYWLELDGRPVAAEYQFTGGGEASSGAVYAYQSGVEPLALDDEPGRLISLATMRAARAEGLAAMDFLRGDEPYKAHWRAVARPTVDVRIVPSSAEARLRSGIYTAGKGLKSALKRGLSLTRAWKT